MKQSAQVRLNATEITRLVRQFEADGCAPFHRNESWAICFQAFEDRKAIHTVPARTDLAALHLGWYLASWGMMRGSSSLLQRNYRILIEVVNTITDARFDMLYGFIPEPAEVSEYIETVWGPKGLIPSIRKALTDQDPTFRVTDTLVTKIALGALGSTVAYDTFVTTALSSLGLTSTLGKRSLRGVIQLYHDHQHGFEQVSRELSRPTCPFKLLDVVLFQLGQELTTAQS